MRKIQKYLALDKTASIINTNADVILQSAKANLLLNRNTIKRLFTA